MSALPQHVGLGLAQAAEIDRHRLGPSEQDPGAAEKRAQCQNASRHEQGAHRVDMLDRVERDAPGQMRGGIAKVPCDIAMRRLVQGDREQHRDGPDRKSRYQ